MTTGVTLYDWGGRPAITRDGQVRYVSTPGEGWTGGTEGAAVSLATLRKEAASIGRDVFDDRFAGPPWSVPNLDGWYLRPETLAAQPFDWARARRYASR